MADRILADATVALHFAFIVFVVLGGVLVWRNKAWAWAHLPAVAWVAYLEFSGAICPLTPLENALRTRAGDSGYTGGFIEHYLIPIVYPPDLTAKLQIVIGLGVVALNVVVYALAWRRRPKGPR